MTQATLTPGFTKDAFDAFLSARNEPDWLIDRRRSAWKVFCEQELPSRSDEEWMRTDIRLFKLDSFGIPGELQGEIEIPTPLLTAGVDLAGQGASLNGQTVDYSIGQQWIDQGVLFGDLARLTVEHSELLRPYLMKGAFDFAADKFSALHGACWSSGTLLYVPRGVVVDGPFHALSALADGGVDLGHLLVILEEGSEATLLTETANTGSGAGGFHCGATEIIVGPNAHLRYVSLQNWDQRVWHFSHENVVVKGDASLQWTMGALGSRLAKVNQHVELTGEGAQVQVNGTMFTEGRQHLSYHTRQHHVAPNCRSDFLYKAALQDKSRTIWRGMIKVDLAAQKTNGYQRNDNLLLSSQARADAIPGLEIDADDVRCTHGSTTSRVDDEMIFYAESRGFTRNEAIRMIVTGFFQQIFDRISIESVRESLGMAIARRVREYE